MERGDHLFRRESGRMVAALTRLFGVHNLALAEDVVQEAFCRAIEVWRFRGVPDNPAAWLMATAKNCALDVLRRQRTAQALAPALEYHLRSEWTLAPAVEEHFAAGAIRDDLLRMMFSCCQPNLTEPAQVALILHILCGFTVSEVASAFMSGYDAIEKRITRAKKVLAASQELFDVSAPAEFSARLPAVQRALYLLFNEGYHGASPQAAVRSELCHEAMRLAAELLRHPQGSTPESYALSALMCLHAARLPARVDPAGDLHSLADQDRSRWDPELRGDGLKLLELSAAGSNLSEFHLEAAIAAFHAAATDTANTDWVAIASLYDTLLSLSPSPVVALNRAIAVAQRDGPERGLEEIRSIAERDRLSRYPFYFAALGELELQRGRLQTAREHFRSASSLARSPAERRFLDRRASACER
jgi:RNA polymerase sigma-70 factor (ECF subfamily)